MRRPRPRRCSSARWCRRRWRRGAATGRRTGSGRSRGSDERLLPRVSVVVAGEMVDPEHRAVAGPACRRCRRPSWSLCLLHPRLEREASVVEGAEGAEAARGRRCRRTKARRRCGRSPSVAPVIVPLRPLPEASLAIAPDPSSNAYAATRPGVGPRTASSRPLEPPRRRSSRRRRKPRPRTGGPSSRRGR